MTDREDVFDYVVVGAGTSGSVIASRLSGDPDTRVLLLEAGGSDSNRSIRNPFVPSMFQAWQDPGVTKSYVTVRKQPPEGDWPPVPWPVMWRGIVRGGCSSIHGMIYVRGNRRNYDDWAARGNRGWGWDDVLPYFKRSEDFELGQSDHHGVGGPLPVRRLIDPTPAAQAFTQAATGLGFDGPNWDFNGPRQEDGAGLYQVNVFHDDVRGSASIAFLDPVQHRPNLTEKLGVQACRIAFEGRRAVGVDCLVNEADHTYREGVGRHFRAEREVILAAGAFESPKLLMLSGIGPRAQLKTHGITPRAVLPGVGANLHDHLLTIMYFEASRGLPVSRFTAEAGLFTHTLGRDKSLAPDLQFHVSGAIDFFTPGAFPPENFLISPTLCQAESVGFTRLMSDDPRHALYIQPNYLQKEADVRVLAEGVELARELANTAPLSELNRRELEPGPKVTGAALHQHIRDTARTVWHPAGTCKMGRDELSVVDPSLRVYGVDGLRVADASIMPTSPAGNTNAVCIMIGEKAADLIRSDPA